MKVKMFHFATASVFAVAVIIIILHSIRSGRGIETPVDDGVVSNLRGKKESRTAVNTTAKRRTSNNEQRKELTNIENFRSRWKQLDKIASSQEALDQKLLLIKSASENGLAAKILAELNENVGPGSDRDKMLMQLFAADATPIDDVKNMLSKLPSSSERRQAYSGLTTRIQRSDDLKVFVPLFDSADKNLVTAIATGAAKWVAKGDSGGINGRNEALSEVKEFCDLLPSAQRLGILQEVLYLSTNGKQAFETWTYARNNGLPSEKMETRLKQRLVFEMFRTDQESALATLGKESDSDGFNFAIEYLFKKDSMAAQKWVAKNIDMLSINNRDIATSVSVKSLLQQGQVEQAKEKIAVISSPEARTKLDQQIVEKERSQLRSEMAKEPEKTVNDIASGNSRFKDSYLEEAILSWVSKDQQNAASWYQRNWDTLTAGKQQYVAAAFVSWAVAQKDLETANEWMKFVTDEAVRDRLKKKMAE